MPFAKKNDRRLTYADYVSWPDDERWEIIDGIAYNMTPTPSTSHQTLVGNFFQAFRAALQGSPCRCFVAPTDVVFSEHDVVQPDVLVVCDRTKITEANIQGAPDLVVEVASPSTGLKDKREKRALYEKYGVREYILVDPFLKCVERFVLGAGGTYEEACVLGAEDALEIVCLPGVAIQLLELFEE